MRILLPVLTLILCLPYTAQAITPCWHAIQTMEDGEGLKECARLYEEEGDSRAALYLSGIALLRGNEKSCSICDGTGIFLG